MNHLAHSLLGFGEPALLTGQFAADAARGPDLSAWPARVATGIRLHRFVDAWTDADPGLLALRRGFAPTRRRFAGIALDVGLDHRLAAAWPRHAGASAEPTLAAHARAVDRDLAAARETARRAGTPWPDGLERLRLALARERLFERWASAEGVALTLERIARRRPGFAPLADCADDLARLEAPLDELMTRFWPALREATRVRLHRLSDAAP